MAAGLCSAGHKVYAPSLDGCAERKHQVRAGITTETHATEIADMLFYEDLNDVVMVGTSSGGMVLCRAAEAARERIARVVFVDALALFDGERIRDIVQRSTAMPSGLTAGPSREDAETRLFADHSTRRPAPGPCHVKRCTRSGSTSIPRGCRASGRSHG